MKIKDAKITSINGQTHISWQMEDNTWAASKAFDISDEILQDVTALKNWIQDYKDAYNKGKDIEAAEAAIPVVPPEVQGLINQSLNLE